MKKLKKVLRKILGLLNKIDDILMQALKNIWQTLKTAFGVN